MSTYTISIWKLGFGWQAVDFGRVYKEVKGVESTEEIFIGSVKIRSIFTALVKLLDAQLGFLD